MEIMMNMYTTQYLDITAKLHLAQVDRYKEVPLYYQGGTKSLWHGYIGQAFTIILKPLHEQILHLIQRQVSNLPRAAAVYFLYHGHLLSTFT